MQAPDVTGQENKSYGIIRSKLINKKITMRTVISENSILLG
jgi:hypothetical protein